MLFEFNVYSGLLLPSVIQGLLFCGLLLWRGIRVEQLSDKILSFILLLYTLRVANWMLGFAGWYDSHDAYTTFMFYFPFNNWLALGPAIYFLFLSLTNRSFRFKKSHLWHFLPALLEICSTLTAFGYDIVYQHWLLKLPLEGHFGTRGKLIDEGLPIIGDLFSIGTYFSIFAYTLYTIRLYRKYRTYLDNHFANLENINYHWLRNLLYAIIFGIGIWMTFNVVEYFSGQQLSYIQDWYSYFCWGIIIYYVSIEGYYQQFHTKPKNLAFQADAVPLPSTSTTAEPPAFQSELQLFMQLQKPFLDADLSLSKLADALNTTTASLSKTINEVFDQNFNEFINSYRVEEVKQKLMDKQYEHLSILGIAFDCGFKSKATFNRAFRKHTGLSPTEYKKSQKNKQVSNP